MVVFLKAMYEQWRCGQTDIECERRYRDFIKFAARHLSRDEIEIEQYLNTVTWFRKKD